MCELRHLLGVQSTLPVQQQDMHRCTGSCVCEVRGRAVLQLTNAGLSPPQRSVCISRHHRQSKMVVNPCLNATYLCAYDRGHVPQLIVM